VRRRRVTSREAAKAQPTIKGKPQRRVKGPRTEYGRSQNQTAAAAA